ncbi:MAG: T9SS type A sorting domain-containing protein [Dysgonamonadaceae bacterium]|jgi:hypothetical protein|nr:T9SS type A sorting domain-containing protein [Dysgonamonadaceae bacterium]
MKTKILLFMLFLFTGIKTIVAEDTYIPMIVPGNQWNELAENISLPPEYQYERTYITILGNDTIIDELTYYKLLTAKDASSNVWESNGYIREDAVNQKVYYKPENHPEWLLYDFDVQVGDIIQSYENQYSFQEVSITVRAIDYISTGDKLRKKITVRSTCFDEDATYFEDHVWIEGIGCMDGFLRSTFALNPDGREQLSLLCFSQNEELIYKPAEIGIEDCFVWRYQNQTGIRDRQVMSGCSIRIIDNTLFLSLEQDATFEIAILDAEGKILLKENGRGNQFQTNINRLYSGVYLVNVQAGNQVFNCKIIKK